MYVVWVQEACRKELTQALQEKEQQAALALEEAELQKTAIQKEGQGHAQELQQELETARTVSILKILFSSHAMGRVYIEVEANNMCK